MLNRTVLKPWIDWGLATGKALFYLKASGLIYPRPVVAELCSSCHCQGLGGLGSELGDVIKIQHESVSWKHIQNDKPQSISLLFQSNRFPSCTELGWMSEEVSAVSGCFISCHVSLKTELVLKRPGKLTLIRKMKHVSTPTALEAKSKAVWSQQRNFHRLQMPSHQALGSTRVPWEPEERIKESRDSDASTWFILWPHHTISEIISLTGIVVICIGQG